MTGAFLDAPHEHAAQELLHSLGCTDGLPVVIPTRARVAAMIAGGRAPAEDVLGIVEPRMGVATVESVAVNAVLAGCLPRHFGVVCAAVRAVCRPEFGLGIVQATTHNAAPLLIVNGGPDDLASGTGALGPGFRANATIGRALRLVLFNAGGARPGAGDMATLGQPAKFTFVVGEVDAGNPFGPLAGGASVTAVAVEGPSQVMFVPRGDTPMADADRLLDMIARTACAPGSMAGMGYRGSCTLLLSPLHANMLASAGFTRASLQNAVFERASLPASEIRRWHANVRGQPTAADDAMISALSSPSHLTVAVAGGAGTYSVVLRGLADGVGIAVTEPIT